MTADEYVQLLTDPDATGFTQDGAPVTLQQVAAHLPACFVCGGVPDTIGCFRPYPARRRAFLAVTEPCFGPVQLGKERVVFYALCAACAATPATLADVEAQLLGTTAP